MIFNNINESAIELDAVQESKYPLGLEGALMHVYENEVNYNNIIKAVGMKELQYYQETGQDLFLNEAGALGSFGESIKKFFKAVIEKIKSMVKKFIMFVESKVSKDDKAFVKKYAKDLYRVDMTNFEFNGYKFKEDAVKKDHKAPTAGEVEKAVGLKLNDGRLDSDDENTIKETFRGAIIGKGQLTEAEFRSEIAEAWGIDEKETLDKVSIREELSFIESTKELIKGVDKHYKAIIKTIDGYLKDIDSSIKEISKYDSREETNPGVSQHKTNKIAALNAQYSVLKSLSNDYTVYQGLVIDFYKKRNAQAKAICVKALNYKPKNESAVYDSNDIFGNIQFN